MTAADFGLSVCAFVWLMGLLAVLAAAWGARA